MGQRMLAATERASPRRLVLVRRPLVMVITSSPLRGWRVLSTLILGVTPLAVRAAVISSRFLVESVIGCSLVWYVAIVSPRGGQTGRQSPVRRLSQCVLVGCCREHAKSSDHDELEHEQTVEVRGAGFGQSGDHQAISSSISSISAVSIRPSIQRVPSWGHLSEAILQRRDQGIVADPLTEATCLFNVGDSETVHGLVVVDPQGGIPGFVVGPSVECGGSGHLISFVWYTAIVGHRGSDFRPEWTVHSSVTLSIDSSS